VGLTGTKNTGPRKDIDPTVSGFTKREDQKRGYAEPSHQSGWVKSIAKSLGGEPICCFMSGEGEDPMRKPNAKSRENSLTERSVRDEKIRENKKV